MRRQLIIHSSYEISFASWQSMVFEAAFVKRFKHIMALHWIHVGQSVEGREPAEKWTDVWNGKERLEKNIK